MTAQNISNEQKASFYDLPTELFCLIHPESKVILQASPGFEYILGWKGEELINHPFTDFICNKEELDNTEKLLSKVQSGIHSLTFDTEFKTKNNSARHINWKCYVDTETQIIYATGRDVTSYKENQKYLSNQANIDALTTLNNRHLFLTLLQQELSSAFRYHYPTAVILLNIDHFRDYNLQHGVTKSDECLKQIAHTLKTALRRKTDFLARFENDEFIILLTHNDLEKALKSANYLRDCVNKSGKISLSLSVCALPEKTDKEISIDQVLVALRKAMTLNKKNGENQINYVSNLS